MKHKRIGKIGDVVIEVKSTPNPWEEGIGRGAVVLATGLHGSLRGMGARYWATELKTGRHVMRRIGEHIRQALWVEPARPTWIAVKLDASGEERECSICVATAFDRHGPHPDNARRAVRAIALEAESRGIRYLSVPLLGAGAGGLDPLVVLQRELEAVAAHCADENVELRGFTILVREPEYDTVAAAAARIVSGTQGANKWYRSIEEQGNFERITVLERLQGGYSGARLDVCEVMGRAGARLPLTVFKIGPSEMIRQEAAGAALASDHLGEFAVQVTKTYELDAKFGALRMPLVTGDHLGHPAMSYLRFFKASGDPREVAEPLALLFGKATQSIYEGGGHAWSRLSELRECMERARGGKYWIEAKQGFARLLRTANPHCVRGESRVSLPYPVDASIDDPFHDDAPLARVWDDRIEAPQARMTHGDLNPRNVVMIRRDGEARFVPRLIDFHRFGNAGPLATDFARFEAGIHIKCLEREIRNTDEDAAERLIRYEELVLSEFVPSVASSLVGTVSPEFAKAVFAVSAVRARYAALAGAHDTRCYWMFLALCLLSYLRPVYDVRLTNGQRSFASFMAANILQRHVVQ